MGLYMSGHVCVHESMRWGKCRRKHACMLKFLPFLPPVKHISSIAHPEREKRKTKIRVTRT